MPGVTRLVLKNRKGTLTDNGFSEQIVRWIGFVVVEGFVKMALQTGCHLVPSFSFGENYLFRPLLDNAPGSVTRDVQRKIQQKLGVAPVLFVGRGLFNYSFGILPQRVPVTTVGKVILEA